MYVWGLTTCLTIFAYSFDTIDALPQYLKPGFGTEGCFVKGLHIAPSYCALLTQYFEQNF